MPDVEEAYQALKAAVKERGLMRRAYVYYSVYATIVLTGILSSLYFVTATDSMLLQVLNGVFLGVMSVQAGMFGHDLSHSQVFVSPRLNRFAALVVWGLVGGLSESKWYEKHNAHHEAPNKIGHDPDLDIPFIFSENQIPYRSAFFKKWILPYQHILFFASLPFIYITWIVFSMRHIFQGFSVRTFTELCLMCIRHSLLLYIVFANLPFWTGCIFIATLFSVAGLYMSLVFAPNHKGEEVLGPGEEESWIHQITLTRNLYPSVLVFHVFGGLNFQIEHHLFPGMPRINYCKAQPMVKEFAIANGLSYHETSFIGSMKEIYSALKEQAVFSRKA